MRETDEYLSPVSRAIYSPASRFSSGENRSWSRALAWAMASIARETASSSCRFRASFSSSSSRLAARGLEGPPDLVQLGAGLPQLVRRQGQGLVDLLGAHLRGGQLRPLPLGALRPLGGQVLHAAAALLRPLLGQGQVMVQVQRPAQGRRAAEEVRRLRGEFVDKVQQLSLCGVPPAVALSHGIPDDLRFVDGLVRALAALPVIPRQGGKLLRGLDAIGRQKAIGLFLELLPTGAGKNGAQHGHGAHSGGQGG